MATTNLGLKIYAINEKFIIVGNSNSFNRNMEIIDGAVGDLRTRVAKTEPSNAGTTGQVLRKTDSGAKWDDNASAAEIIAAVEAWLDENVPSGETLIADRSLEIDGAAAESTTVGAFRTEFKDAIAALAAMGLVVYNGQFYINPDGNTLPA